MLNRIRCSNCHKLVKYKDFVYLDIVNTVIHQRCYSPEFEVKDKGTFSDITEKYNFFEQLKA